MWLEVLPISLMDIQIIAPGSIWVVDKNPYFSNILVNNTDSTIHVIIIYVISIVMSCKKKYDVKIFEKIKKSIFVTWFNVKTRDFKMGPFKISGKNNAIMRLRTNALNGKGNWRMVFP